MWKALGVNSPASVNKLAANLTNQVRSIARVTKAVALGDLSKQIDVDARGEILDLKILSMEWSSVSVLSLLKSLVLRWRLDRKVYSEDRLTFPMLKAYARVDAKCTHFFGRGVRACVPDAPFSLGQ